MISFLLVTLGFFISSFSSCFRCRVRLFIWFFSCFLRKAYIAMNLPLSIAFIESHRFWIAVFSFSFVFMYIYISFFIFYVICWLFRSMLFSLHMFVFFIVVFLWLASNLTSLWSEKMLEVISFFKIYQGQIYSPECGISWGLFCVHLKKKVKSIVLGWNAL